MLEKLRTWASGRGYLVAWGPVELVAAVRAEVARLGTSGVVAKEFYASELGSLAETQSGRERGLATVLMVVMPRPAHTASFDVDGRRIEVVLPPTYVRYRDVFEEVAADLRASALRGARIERLMAPIKPLAVRLGLVRYGRNNVTYAPGMGSYIQLLGYLTDAKFPQPDGWPPYEPTLLPACEGCGACRAACPTGAIATDRVLLHADRCLTYVNENPGPWPGFVPARAHHCLLGCLLCQRACPANPKLRIESTGVVFDREQTEALLADTGDHAAPVWDGVRENLARLGQPHSEPMVGRNLRALVEAADARARLRPGG
jgi:epoxyqueuosine reductase